MDKLQNDQPIFVDKTPTVRNTDKPLQKSGMENLCVVGSDVASLFPSINNVEAGRLVRHAILKSDVRIENFDYLTALRFLTIVGGRELLQKVGVSRLEPKWLGNRQDLTSLGGLSQEIQILGLIPNEKSMSLKRKLSWLQCWKLW